jgi:hypothetical protein
MLLPIILPRKTAPTVLTRRDDDFLMDGGHVTAEVFLAIEAVLRVFAAGVRAFEVSAAVVSPAGAGRIVRSWVGGCGGSESGLLAGCAAGLGG